jgi:hypothetical protein
MQADYRWLPCVVLPLFKYGLGLGVKNLDYVLAASYIADEIVALNPSHTENTLIFLLLAKLTQELEWQISLLPHIFDVVRSRQNALSRGKENLVPVFVYFSPSRYALVVDNRLSLFDSLGYNLYFLNKASVVAYIGYPRIN